MAKFKPYNLNRKLNIKLDIDHIIGEDHLCKQIEYIVSGLDTSKIEGGYSPVGQNALHPKMMLGIVFYGYAVGVRSGRKLAISCQENLPFIYLSKGYFPQKTVLNEFRRKNYLYFNDLFVQVLKMAGQQGLGDFAFSIGDGTKIGANSSKRRTKNKEQFGKWKASLLEDILEIEKELSEEETGLGKEGIKKN
jgi:transposase